MYKYDVFYLVEMYLIFLKRNYNILCTSTLKHMITNLWWYILVWISRVRLWFKAYQIKVKIDYFNVLWYTFNDDNCFGCVSVSSSINTSLTLMPLVSPGNTWTNRILNALIFVCLFNLLVLYAHGYFQKQCYYNLYYI